jgi:hypothetical protein
MTIELIEHDAQPTAVKTILNAFALPAIGTHWIEEGGIFAGLVRTAPGEPFRALIVSAPDAGGDLDPAEWGKYGQDIERAKSKTDGATNTRAMAEAGSEIAQKVLALDIGGKTDWHIGSQGEMHVAAANVPDLFEFGCWYWTSTQFSSNLAFFQVFERGYSFWYYLDDVFRVRAVRTIQLQPLNA